MLSEHLKDIFSHWKTPDIRSRDDSLAVWDIGRPGLWARDRRKRRQAVAECRREILGAVLEFNGPIFVVHEPPLDCDVPGDWQPAGERTWLVPPDFDHNHPGVQYWLFHLSNWRIYCASNPVNGQWLDAFGCSAGELLAWMSARSVAALIQSFHDDTEWVVAFDTRNTS